MNNLPRFNGLIADIRILIDDPVSGVDDGIKATTDGRVTASKVNHYAISAMKELVKRLHDNYGEMAQDLAPGLVKTQDIVFSADGVDINKDFMYATGLLEVEVES